MAQVCTTKQQNFLSRFTTAVVALLAANDALNALATEYTVDLYGSGQANAFTDAVVQTVIPAATAAQTYAAATGVGTILTAVSTNRAGLEMMRP
jgi:hypothetical protein